MFADVTFSTEAVAAITLLGGGLVTAVVFLFRLVIKSKDDAATAMFVAKDVAFAEMREQRDTFKKMGQEAVGLLEEHVNQERQSRGAPRLDRLPAVIPEHNSPTTQKQEDAAALATLRAMLTALRREMGIEPRVAGDEDVPVDRFVQAASKEQQDTVSQLETAIRKLERIIATRGGAAVSDYGIEEAPALTAQAERVGVVKERIEKIAEARASGAPITVDDE
jgi:hypothetical protein